MTRLTHDKAVELYEMLELYMVDGSQSSLTCLWQKYQALYEQLLTQIDFPMQYCEREQLELLSCILLKHYKNNEMFERIVADFNRLLAIHEYQIFVDLFIEEAEHIVGKSKFNEYILANKYEYFMRKYKESNELSNKIKGWNEENYIYTSDEFLRLCNTSRIQVKYIRLFMKYATNDTIREVASMLSNNKQFNDNILRLFIHVDFPLDCQILINYYEDGYILALYALARLSNPCIRNKIDEIYKHDGFCAIELFIHNYVDGDEVYILDKIQEQEIIECGEQQIIADIFLTNKTKKAQTILKKVYREGVCSVCRMKVIEAMAVNGCISEEIIHECLYDVNDQIKAWANRRSNLNLSKIG